MAEGIKIDSYNLSEGEQQNIDILMLVWAVKKLVVDVATLHGNASDAQGYVNQFGKSMDSFIDDATKEDKPIDKAWREEMETVRRMLTDGIKFD